jgi:hypothetical protein
MSLATPPPSPIGTATITKPRRPRRFVTKLIHHECVLCQHYKKAILSYLVGSMSHRKAQPHVLPHSIATSHLAKGLFPFFSFIFFRNYMNIFIFLKKKIRVILVFLLTFWINIVVIWRDIVNLI